MIRFTVPGRPVPAVRMTRRSKHVNPQAQRYLAYKTEVGWAARAVMGSRQPLPDLVVVTLRFWICQGEHGYVRGGRRRTTADTDNLVKAALDGCNAIVWEDDTQVAEIHAFRIAAERANEQRAEIEVDVVAPTASATAQKHTTEAMR